MTLPIGTHISLLIVDDHEMVRLGLAQMLTSYEGLEVIGQAGTVADAVAKAVQLKPNVVLLDLRLPDGEGHEACRKIKSLVPATKVIVLTSYTDDLRVFESITAGANGYLLKEIGADELVDAIYEVNNGKSILSPSVTDRVLNRIKTSSADEPGAKMNLLSAQEQRVLALVAEGKTNKEIGMSLTLSDKTVKNYLSNAMEKLDISRRAEAAAFFARYGNR